STSLSHSRSKIRQTTTSSDKTVTSPTTAPFRAITNKYSSNSTDKTGVRHSLGFSDNIIM
ncbi:hypothetical protein GIB67_009785, partial [Kingdonia uniflora]